MQLPDELAGEVNDSVGAERSGAHGERGPAARPEAMAGPLPFQVSVAPRALLLLASGTYEWTSAAPSPAPQPPFWADREELRLDIDGPYPAQVASGTLYGGLTMRIHWIANLTQAGPGQYTGFIWYKDGNASWLPYTNVRIRVLRSPFPNRRRAKVTFTGGRAPQRVRTYAWRSPYFRAAEFEYDAVQGTAAVTSIGTRDHPNCPARLAAEPLSIEAVFQRAGFHVTKSGGDNVIPISRAGANARWSDMEMHDAMQAYWSRFANRPQWSMWVLFAGLHDRGTSLGGIMFDSIGPNHRQGTAIFNNSFIANAPPGDPKPAAWVRRMKFWTACHEMGHAFNLAHSWQKALGTPWIPLRDEPEARSFMNYPYNVRGGERTFFADFEYRFSDGELLFMRHAPERFVQMGNADWFDHHGFQQANALLAPTFALEVRFHRSLDYFEFLEPVVVELKLKNVSSQPQVVDEAILKESDHLTLIVKKRDRPARQWRPFGQYCYHGDKKVLMPGESLYASLPINAGLDGWSIAEPGVYTVQAALRVGEEDVVSDALQVRVAPPRGYDEEFLAQDCFSDEVGRVLAFNGTRFLDKANDVLHEVADRLPDSRVAYHARLALGNPLMHDYKLLVMEADGQAAVAGDGTQKVFEVLEAKPDAARDALSEALLNDPVRATDTLGHIDYRQMVEQFSAFLAEQGDAGAAVNSLQKAEKTLASRKVLGSVVKGLAQLRKRYAKQSDA